MKTLVIHPDDRSTDFLKAVYKDLPDVTLVTGGCYKDDIRRMIEAHDRVIMLGHGTPHGLLGMGAFPHCGFIVDDTHADVLKEKDNSIFIWCNADQYVGYNKLKGFNTGMFVSEVGEARVMGLPFGTNQNHVDESNEAFVKAVSMVIDDDPELLHRYVKHDYGELAWRNPVAKYNYDRLYLS